MVRKILLSLVVVLSVAFSGFAQKQQVSGSVSDTSGSPIVGATVVVAGTNTGTTTGTDGSFAIAVPKGGTVEVSYIGYQTQTLVVKSKSRLDVVLNDDAQVLDDVVVVAFGTAKKESLTGSISVVGSDEIEQRIATSVTGALEGGATGVQVNSTYGEPGAAPTIRIRGFGSVTGVNSPLYVVDGVAFSGNIAEINPNDIASMSVLKDAASAALYGNRAANGVVLITTKKGSTQKTQVNVSINQGVYNRGIAEYDRMGADEWMETSWDAMKNFALNNEALGITSAADAGAWATENLIGEYAKRNIYDAGDKELFDADGNLTAKVLPGYTDLDWAEGVERVGKRSEYSVSGSTSSDKFSVFSSVGYLNEQGYVVGTEYERFTGRVNTTYRANDWFETGINLSGARTTQNYNDSANGNYYANPFYVVRRMAPIYPMYLHEADGSFLMDEFGDKQFDTESSYLDNRNIAYELREDVQKQNRNVFNTQAFATLNLPFNIDFTVKADMSNSTTNKSQFNNPNIGDGANNNGRLTSEAYQYQDYTVQQLLNWGDTFDSVHNVDVMLGHENYSWDRSYTAGMNTGMSVDGNYTMGNFTTQSYFLGSDDAYRTESYLARGRYNYDSRYFFEASFRRDGSSRFAPQNRWGNFFSVGASWNMKKESFLENVDWVDFLKFRTAYGEVGNDAGVDYYAYMALYTIDKNGGKPAYIKESLDASDIQWESTRTFDIGFDGTLFNCLNFELGYFDKRSSDLLFAVKLPLSAGSYPYDENNQNLTQYKNIGEISNRGVELAIDVDVIRNKAWSWNVGFDATFLKNEVVKLPDGEDILSGVRKYSEGHSIYEFFTYHFEGVDQMTGRSLYTLDAEKAEAATDNGELVTINGKDYTTSTTYALRDWAGSALPDVYGSFSSALRYKSLTLNMLFTYSLGGKTYDASYQALMSTNAMSSGAAYHSDLANSWSGVPAGMTEDSSNRVDVDGTPAADFHFSSDNNATSDRWLVDSSYLVCKNISLSYNLPKSFTQKLSLSNVAVSAGVENLFTLTARKGLNPQYSYSGGSDDTYVTARVFNMGLKINF